MSMISLALEHISSVPKLLLLCCFEPPDSPAAEKKEVSGLWKCSKAIKIRV